MEHLNQSMTAIQAAWLTISALCYLLSAGVSVVRGSYASGTTPAGLKALDAAIVVITIVVTSQAYDTIASAKWGSSSLAVYVAIGLLGAAWQILWDLTSTFYHGHLGAKKRVEVRLPREEIFINN